MKTRRTGMAVPPPAVSGRGLAGHVSAVTLGTPGGPAPMHRHQMSDAGDLIGEAVVNWYQVHMPSRYHGHGLRTHANL